MKKTIITDITKIEPKHRNEHEQYEYFIHEVTDGKEKCESTGSDGKNQTVVAFYNIPPGKSNFPLHYHTTNEEVFYVISGTGVLENTDEKHTIKAGDVIVCPAGKHGAHKITNTSETEALVYLDADTNHTPDLVYYPDSNKVGIRAIGGIRDNFNLNSKVDYYDNE